MVKSKKIDVVHEKLEYYGNDLFSSLNEIDELNDLRGFLKRFGAIGFDKNSKEHYGNISKKINEFCFLCSPSQTSGLEKISREEYVLIFGFDGKKLKEYGLRDNESDSEAPIHLGFYKGNNNIKCIAYGHHLLLHNYFKDKKEAIIWDEKVEVDGLEGMSFARKSGEDERILGNRSDYGNWGIVIPKGNLPGFFLLGENVDSVKFGFLKSIQTPSFNMIDKTNKELTTLYEKSQIKEGYLEKERVYFP